MNLSFPIPAGASNPVPCSRTSDVCRVFDATEENLKEYHDSLTDAGFSLITERRLPSGIFYTYTKDKAKLSVSLLRTRKELRVFSSFNHPLPPFSAMGEKKHNFVTLTQFSTASSQSVDSKSCSGMGYILRLRDGRLIVIDGGFHSEPFEDDYPELVRVMWELSDGKKPHVAAWIITHSHLDHYGSLAKFTEEDADIDAYISLLSKEGVADNACLDMMSSIPNYSEKNYAPHAAERIDFGDVVMDVHYTYEEGELYSPERVQGDVNNHSLIFSFTVDGQKLLFVGDAYYHAAILAAELASDDIKADICQIGHHGRTTSKDDLFYQLVAPKVALWPGCYEHIDLFRLIRGTNRWIFGEESTIVDHFVATDGHQTLTLPYTPVGLPYCSEGRYPPENLTK